MPETGIVARRQCRRIPRASSDQASGVIVIRHDDARWRASPVTISPKYATVARGDGFPDDKMARLARDFQPIGGSVRACKWRRPREVSVIRARIQGDATWPSSIVQSVVSKKECPLAALERSNAAIPLSASTGRRTCGVACLLWLGTSCPVGCSPGRQDGPGRHHATGQNFRPEVPDW